MNLPVINEWSTDTISGSATYDAWEDKLTSNYGRWQIAHPKQRDFSARMRSASVGDLRIVDCTCDPCGAERSGTLVRQDQREMLAIQLVLSGREQMRFGGERYSLSAGDIFVWDSTQPMSFNVVERLHKVSLLMPLERLKHWLSGDWRSIPRQMPSHCANRMLLSSMLTTMTQDSFAHAELDDETAAEAAIALISGSVKRRLDKCDSTIKRGQLERLKLFIEKHLSEPDLSLDGIAAANRISVRHLHWAFSGSGDTASRYIIHQRLARSRRDLQNPGMHARSVSEIAFACGFTNLAHFSKRYRERYGESPSDTRCASSLPSSTRSS